MRRLQSIVPLVLLPFAACIPKQKDTGPAQGPHPASLEEQRPAHKPDLPGNPAPAMPGKNVPAIKVDTVGYPTGWVKIAIFNVEPKGAVIKDESGAVAHKIDKSKVKKFGLDRASQDKVWQVDFTEFKKPGRYTIESGNAKSHPFEIGKDVYDKALIAAQKAFYFQRTRCKLEKPYAVWEGDEFLREGVSHVHENVGWDIKSYPEKKKKWNVEAGWHDAGNFDMYVPSTGPTAQGLLMAYEAHPELFKDKDLNIPESGNGIPDLLDEAKWGIRWVLSVQEPDGGFRLRETTMTQGEAPIGPAHKDMTVRWIDLVGSASTAKGCALAAVASRVYREHDPDFAQRAEEAAKKAWGWLERHPKRVMVPATGDAKKEGYLLWDDGPEVKSDIGARFNAAAEMWTTFREQSALGKIKKMLKMHETSQYDYPYGSWVNLTRWGIRALAFDKKTPKSLRAEAKKRLFAAANMCREQVEKKDGYLNATQPQDYYWGSNSNLMEKTQLMIWAAKLDPKGYGWAVQAARHQWHWIMGRNPNGFSMVTRVGKGPNALYHTEWGPHYPKVPPGYLVGGPNYDDMKFFAPGAPAKAILWEAPRALESGVPKGELWHWVQSDLWDGEFIPRDSWDDGWWAVTEPDVYYNMNLVLVAAEMQE